MEGTISCIKHNGKALSYFAAKIEGTDAAVFEVESNTVLNLGELVEVDQDYSQKSFRTDGSGQQVEKLLQNADKLAEMYVVNEPYKTGAEDLDNATSRMWTNLKSAAKIIIRKILLGSPILVRFHNDADGASGAYCLYNAINDFVEKQKIQKQNIIWIMNKGIMYGESEASLDILVLNNYESIEKPAVILIDFGTAEESNGGVNLMKEKFDIIWLEHHPIVEKFFGVKLKNYINPWLFGSDSNYTAGFLACALSKTFSDTDTKEIENASFIGDYSVYGNLDSRGRELSTILDLVTSGVGLAGGSSENLTPKEIQNIVEDGKRSKELLDYANVKLGSAIEAALGSLKMYKTGAGELYVTDFEEFKDGDSKYPLPGRLSSKILEKIVQLNGKESILMLHIGKYISVRLTKELSKKIDILDIIKELKERHGSKIETGGGHRAAASIKLSDKKDKSRILRDLIGLIKARIEAI